mgnify:CR=1 FL=1
MSEPYTEEKKQFLLQYGAELSTANLTSALNERFSSNHSAGSVRTTVKNLGIKKSAACRSSICANSGKPIGSTTIIQGYRYIKVGVSNGGFFKDWRREIDIAYEKAYGTIPDGYMVVTLDNNKLNASADNLCAISKSIAARMTNGHGRKMWSEFPAVTRAAIELCKLDEIIQSINKGV